MTINDAVLVVDGARTPSLRQLLVRAREIWGEAPDVPTRHHAERICVYLGVTVGDINRAVRGMGELPHRDHRWLDRAIHIVEKGDEEVLASIGFVCAVVEWSRLEQDSLTVHFNDGDPRRAAQLRAEARAAQAAMLGKGG